GVWRDKSVVRGRGLLVWCAGVAAPASVNQLTFVGWNEPIGCGGCAVFPDHVMFSDDERAVVIPKDLVDFVANEGAEHELLESWLVQEVEKGAKLPGLYPPNEENKKPYEDWKKKRLCSSFFRRPSASFSCPPIFCFLLRLRARCCWRHAGDRRACSSSSAPSFCSQSPGCSRLGPSSSTASKAAFRGGTRRAARPTASSCSEPPSRRSFRARSVSRSLRAAGPACSLWPSWPVPIQMHVSSTQ